MCLNDELTTRPCLPLPRPSSLALAGDFLYHTTNDAAQNPVGFFDFDRKIANVFLEFEPVKGGAWPAQVWDKPAECQ